MRCGDAFPSTESTPQPGHSAVCLASIHALIDSGGNVRKQKKQPQRVLASISTRCCDACLWASASCGATCVVATRLVVVVVIVTTDSNDPEDDGITRLVVHAYELLARAHAKQTAAEPRHAKMLDSSGKDVSGDV